MQEVGPLSPRVIHWFVSTVHKLSNAETVPLWLVLTLQNTWLYLELGIGIIIPPTLQLSLKPDGLFVILYPELGIGISVPLSLQQSLKTDAPSVVLYPEPGAWLGAFLCLP